jgi:hypothetical protein
MEHTLKNKIDDILNFSDENDMKVIVIAKDKSGNITVDANMNELDTINVLNETYKQACTYIAKKVFYN